MKNNRHGKSAILTESDYSKIRKNISDSKYRLLFDIAWFTGERWGALIQLQISDVYENSIPRKQITFRKRTRKASPDGSQNTRQVPVHPTLEEILKFHSFNKNTQWLFPGAKLNQHICLRTADYVLRTAVSKAGLTARGISTHSTRRTFINKLYSKGVDLYTIKTITGHKDLKTLMLYIDPSIDKIQGAIASL